MRHFASQHESKLPVESQSSDISLASTREELDELRNRLSDQQEIATMVYLYSSVRLNVSDFLLVCCTVAGSKDLFIQQEQLYHDRINCQQFSDTSYSYRFYEIYNL